VFDGRCLDDLVDMEVLGDMGRTLFIPRHARRGASILRSALIRHHVNGPWIIILWSPLFVDVDTSTYEHCSSANRAEDGVPSGCICGTQKRKVKDQGIVQSGSHASRMVTHVTGVVPQQLTSLDIGCGCLFS
jgi:hypothetical protein